MDKDEKGWEEGLAKVGLQMEHMAMFSPNNFIEISRLLWMAETSESGASRSNERTPAGSAYDVFVSFRGPDTRLGITDHLYETMTREGIRVFRDTEEIRHGEEIGEELRRAIPDSRIYVVVFSKGYASSAWCLRELAMMADGRGDKASGKVILPIFYKVNPSDVKLQTPLYRSALDKHREKYGEGTDTKKYKEEDVKKWEEALEEVGGISGLEYKRYTGKGKFVSDVVADILNKLKIRDRILPDHLIGMDFRVENVINMLNLESHDIRRVVMVHGMGGIGKTTLADVIFNKISSQFDGCSFLANVRESIGEGGVKKLQKKLLADILGKSDTANLDSNELKNQINMRLRGRKVLIIFDDISESIQLEKLIGNLDFFRLGTRIIITTRDSTVCKGLMRSSDIYNYEMKGISDPHALQLFSRHAFGGEWPPDDFVALSEQVIRMTGNLPLALEVIGGHLHGKEKNVWVTTLEKLKEVPDEGVVETLKISYDSLGEREKQIFLDIACFNHYVMPRKYVSYMWEACGFHPKCGLDVLQNRSLIKVLSDNYDDDEVIFWNPKEKYWMHDLIREMGREIVRSESLLHSPGMRSRLWDPKEARDVLRRKEGTHQVLAIDLGWDIHSYTGEEFEGMSNLRFLSLTGGIHQLIGEFRNFWTKLLWLRLILWDSIPNPTFFKMDKLVILEITGGGVSDKSMEDLRMGNLRVLHINWADITRMPDLSHCSKLELIKLVDCGNLEELHSSVGVLGDLKCLKIVGCHHLRRLPKELGSAKALQELILMDCRSMRELPDSIGSLENLRILCGSQINIRKLPSWIGNLKRLEVLQIRGLPFSTPSEMQNHARWNLSGLSRLCSLSLSDLDELGELLGIENLHGLQILKLDAGYEPVLLSTELGSLSRLEELYLRSWDISSISQLPPSLRKLTHVRCRRKEENWKQCQVPFWPMSCEFLPDNLVNLSFLTLESCVHLKLSCLAPLRRLCSLRLERCNYIDFSGVERMELLEELVISHCYDIPCGIPDMSNLRRLKRMVFVHCPTLKSVPRVVGDCRLRVDDCCELESFQGPYRQYLTRENENQNFEFHPLPR